jgi:hypothetical protein
METLEQKLKEIKFFTRFPNLIPHLSDNYGNGTHKKMLLVWESYYDSWNLLKSKTAESWYNDDDIPKLWEQTKVKDHWNFKCKIDKNGCDKNSGTFLNPEKVLKNFEKNDPYSYCAGYNYFLRPAPEAKTLKIEKIDEEYAFDAFKEIVEIIQPDMIAFFSKKAYSSFKEYRKDIKSFDNIKIKAVQHPACVWWNKKSGNPKMNGRERFEKFIEKW